MDEIADIRLGRQRSPKNHVGPQMRPYLRAANVGWAGLKLDDIKSMNFSDSEMGIYQLSPGDVLLNEASGSPGEVGKPALWSGELDECAFQNTLIRIRPHDVEPRYLLHYFRYVALTGGFSGHARGVGIHHLSRARIAGWSTPIPPPDEQRRIVDILEDHLS
ncbi:MAG: restriction endonuclease subunit S, partial [Dermatophilaceae bacterium]